MCHLSTTITGVNKGNAATQTPDAMKQYLKVPSIFVIKVFVLKLFKLCNSKY